MNGPDVIEAMVGGKANGRKIAVIGLSSDPARPSYRVSAYMQAHGYRLLPVNPTVAEVFGVKAYPSLRELPDVPDIVNVFRLPYHVPAIVEEMLELGPANLWVQSGITHPDAAAKAEAGGINVVMDRCIMIEHARLHRGA